MKKFLYLLLVFALTLAVSCKKDKNGDDEQVLTPQQDTSVYPGYEEYYTDESDSDTVTVAVDTADFEETQDAIMVEDNNGNLKPAENSDLQEPGKNFKIIVGSYTKLSNANKRAEYFKKLGYKAVVLDKVGAYNRVAIAQYDDETQARNELAKLRTKFNDKTFWLLYR